MRCSIARCTAPKWVILFMNLIYTCEFAGANPFNTSPSYSGTRANSWTTRHLGCPGTSLNKPSSNKVSPAKIIGISSASLPRWRTGRGFAGNKFVGHAEQVPQHVRIDSRQTNQNGVIPDVVLRYVINIGVRSKQLGAVLEIDAN